jgi:hypothetical protein
MGMKLSAKRLLAVAAVFVLAMVAVPVFQDSQAADYFDQDQWIGVHNTTAELGGVFEWNFDDDSWNYEENWGNWDYYYPLPFGAWLGLFYYSYVEGYYREAVYLWDEDWS